MKDEIKTWVVFSLGWDGFPIAYKLKKEGCEVLVGHVESKTSLGQEDEEKTEETEKRLKQYDGMLEKIPAKKLVEALKKVENKNEYFIFCDQNNLYPIAQELLDAGFTKGLFPMEEDYLFEKDRKEAMQFVRENYPDVKIIPFEEFDNIDEAIEFLTKADKVYVLQSGGDYVPTMVPKGDDIDQERDQMINQLKKNQKDYEQGTIILKEKLIAPIEITPQIVFNNGVPIFCDLDIETKNIGDGENNGNQVGCGSNLVIRTEAQDPINDIAFPRAVYEKALPRIGLFIWDISLYIMPDGMYFGEFCSNRFGYDSIMTEITMAKSAKDFFLDLCCNKNPLKKRFGTAVRLFNLNRKEESEVMVESDNIYLYEVYKKEDRILSLGYCWDLGVATAAANTIEECVKDNYKTIKEMSFKELYTKTMNDFYDVYPTSIIYRFQQTNHIYYDVPDFTKPDERVEMQKKMQEIELDYRSKMQHFKGQLSSIMDKEGISPSLLTDYETGI